MTWEGDDKTGDRFPWFVTIASLVAGLWVFFTSTAAAVDERDLLERTARQSLARREALLDAVSRLRHRRIELPYSADLLRVEFDRRGLLPEEAIERYPTAQPPTAQ